MNYPSSDSGHRKIFILIDLQSIWNVHYNILLQKMLAVGFSYMIYWLRLDLPRPNICEKCSTCDNLPFPVPQPSNIWPLLTSGHASGPRLWFMFLCRWHMLVISPWWYRKDTKKEQLTNKESNILLSYSWLARSYGCCIRVISTWYNIEYMFTKSWYKGVGLYL